MKEEIWRGKNHIKSLENSLSTHITVHENLNPKKHVLEATEKRVTGKRASESVHENTHVSLRKEGFLIQHFKEKPHIRHAWAGFTFPSVTYILLRPL